ncbi:transmembrane protein [methanogenic archaeon ISO4-H5]|nr:transmembrane protein [methanogenic archaeon ISO4-H5]
MRIIGSGRIDDYKKVALEDTVLKAIDAKPGDSVLFYERHNDDAVCIYKAEGARLTNEADAPRRRHMREAFVRMRYILVLTVVVIVLRLAMTVLNYDALGAGRFAITFALGILTLIFVLACINFSRIVDNPYDSQSLVTVGNTYAKDRITGITKVNSDGFVATTNLYINSLFGARVDNVEVLIHPEGGEDFDAVVNLVKSVPGYSVYRVHMKDNIPQAGTMEVIGKYRYLGKFIEVHCQYYIEYDPESKDTKVREGDTTATIEFDNLNKTKFDETWLKESEDMY